jgi:tRNA threonylcarbamoyladenosine biosynthesis protein TsaE
MSSSICNVEILAHFPRDGAHFIGLRLNRPLPVHTPATLEIDLPGPPDTDRLASLLAASMVPGLCVWLSGEPGAGKTHFARALLRALGWAGPVRSPTYTLLETYVLELPAQGAVTWSQAVPVEGSGRSAGADSGTSPLKPEAKSRLMLYHHDLYRLASPDEWAEAGFDDVPGPAVRLIEWPENGGAAVAPADLHIALAAVAERRDVALRARAEPPDEGVQVADGGRRARLTPLTRVGEEACQALVAALERTPAGSAWCWSRVC